MKAQSADASPIIVPKSQQKSDVSFFQMTMGTLIFLMSILTIFVSLQKYESTDSTGTVSAAVVPSTQPAVVESKDNRFDALDARLQKMELSLKRQHHYAWLSMLAINENANMMKSCDGRDYVLFDKEGNLTRMPNTMKLDEEQIQKFDAGVSAIK